MDQEFSFGEWIQRRRNTLGLTQEALAEQVGYSAAMIRKIENDERRPSLKGAALLAEALEIPQDQQDAFLKVVRQERAIDHLGSVDQEESFPWQVAFHPKTNLPLPPNLFVGREEELAKLADLLQDPNCRLVTLVGLAGIGKTRLALQAAHNQLDWFSHGVFFVSLAALASPEAIVTTMARAIGFQFHGADEPQEQLLRYLAEKRMLLVLDNFEHLMEGASLLPEIMQAAPGIQLLVTSRERLNLQGEWIFEIEGLTYPEDTDESRWERVETYGAVQLFLQSALRVDPSFRLNEENREGVVRICQLTEGMPLGIELASAWVRVLSPQVIASEIKSNLGFLKASAQDIPERHRSLRAALDHSWKLLSGREKEVFQQLSVFRGGFGRDAALEVAGASLDELTSLLDKSMLRRVGDERYDMHELLRQYGAAQLQSNAEEYAQTHDRHSNYYAALLEEWKGQIRSSRQIELLAEMDAEMDNIRLAWNWMVTHKKIGNIRKSLHCLWQFHEIRAWLREGANLFGQAMALKTPDEMETEQNAERTLVLGQMLAYQGYFCVQLGWHEEARGLLQESLGRVRSGTDQAVLADTLAILGYMKYRLCEFSEAGQFAQESLSLNRRLGNQVGIVFCLITLAYIYVAQGSYQQAYALSSEGLEICRDVLGDPHGTSDCLIPLSTAARKLGQYTEARRWAEQSLQISKTLNDRWGMAQNLRELGLLNFDLGETDRAEILVRRSVSLSREIGDRTLMAMALADLGVVTRVSGAYSESKQYFLEAFRTAMETQAVIIAVHTLPEIAAIKMNEGETEMALELVTQCLQHPTTSWEIRERAEQLLAKLVTKLTPQQIEAAQTRAQAKTLESLAREHLGA